MKSVPHTKEQVNVQIRWNIQSKEDNWPNAYLSFDPKKVHIVRVGEWNECDASLTWKRREYKEQHWKLQRNEEKTAEWSNREVSVGNQLRETGIRHVNEQTDEHE